MPKGNKANPHATGLLMLRKEKKEKGTKTLESQKKVVMMGAKLTCSYHPTPGTLFVTSNQIRLQNKIWATSADNTKINFIFPAICTHPSNAATKLPCLLLITPMHWEKTGTVKVQGFPTLLKKSRIMCAVSSQYITISHDGQTTTPSVITNLSQPVVSGPASNFTCPPAVRDALQRDVDKKCKSAQRKCFKSDNCPTLEQKINATNACIQARTAINMRCYRGGDDVHKAQITQELNSLINCQAYYFPRCLEPPKQPVPVPVPAPVPAPQTDEDFMEMMERLTGLTGAALIIYLIISEGSRLFPPRNLVPVP